MTGLGRLTDGPKGYGMMANPLGDFGWGLYFVLGIITYIAIIAVLIALARWLWRNGDQKR